MGKSLELSSLSLVRLVIAVGRELNCAKLEVMTFGPCFGTRFLGFLVRVKVRNIVLYLCSCRVSDF